MRDCPNCGHQNPDDVDRCLNCAQTLGRDCPVCGHFAPAGNRFCGNCGVRLAEGPEPWADALWRDQVLQDLRSMIPATLAEKINAASIDAASERREVTVVFLDIANFTTAAYQMNSEAVRSLVNGALRTLVQLIYKYEGTIDEFTSDGLMVLFGVPVAHENDPERAVRAALEMQAALQSLQSRIKQEHGFDLRGHIGINTGLVIAGEPGDLRMEYTAIGDTVNLAAHLEMAATPNTILVSQATYERTRPLFQYDRLQPITLKGWPLPVPAYRPLDLSKKPRALRGLPELQVPMVGRQEALTQLQNALAEVRQHQHARIVLIMGEAGLGKSRLVAEFRKLLVESEVRVHQGASLAYARSKPLWPVADLLRDIFQIREAEPVSVQCDKLQKGLDKLGLASEVSPYLTHLLGLEQVDSEIATRLQLLDASMLQQQTHVALRQAFLAETHLAPTVLIFEDLHWIDSASGAFLEYLIQAIDNAPLMLVLVSRDSESDTAACPLIAAARKNRDRLVDIQLCPLSSAEGELLVNQLLKPTTDEAQTLKVGIVARAEGNPFYAEEIVRMLIDQGGLVGEGDRWQVTPQAFELLQQVPATLKGLILARFDRLPQTLRKTLQEAAVLGRSFPAGLPQQISDASPETVADHLQELQAQQFLVVQQVGAEQEYAFRHALIQEAVYSTLLRRDCQEIHERAGRVIEHGGFWPLDEQVEVLAFHYAESRTPSKAIPYLVTAAENAARRYANEIAIQHYRRALALLQDQFPSVEPALTPTVLTQVLKSGHIRIRLGQALKFVGELTEAHHILAEALQLLQSRELKPGFLAPLLVEDLRELADVRQREGALDEAITHLEAALGVLKDTPGQEYPTLHRSVIDRMAWVRFRQGDLDEAFALAKRATLGVDPDHTDDPTTLASLYNTLGGIFWQRGDLSEASAYVEGSLNLYKNLGYSWGIANAYSNLGTLLYSLGNWPAAVQNLERALTLRREIGDIQLQAQDLHNLGLLHMSMGEHKMARQDMESSLSTSQRLGDTRLTASCHVSLAQLAVLQSRFDDAASSVSAALELSNAIGSLDIQVQARSILALIQAEKGNLQTGWETAEQGLQIAQEAELWEERVYCLRAAGVLRAQTGDYSEAEARLQEAVKLCIEQRDPYQKGLALLELGRLYQRLIQPGNPDCAEWRTKAVTVLDEAAREFQSLGAAYDLQMAQTALRQMQPVKS